MGGNSSQQTLDKYAALAQVYYWIQIFEANKDANWEQILSSTITEDFILYNPDGTWKGKEEYITKVKLLKKWEHTHHTKQVTVKKDAESNGWVVNLECIYQCILPDFSSESYNVILDIVLQPCKNTLPLISSVRVDVLQKIEDARFNTAYKYNRAASFMYKFLYCIEAYKADLTKYNYLFKPGFKSQINNDTLFTASEELSKWIQNNISKYHTSCETELQNVEVIEINKNMANVLFDVCRIPTDLSKQISTARYICTIQYCPNDPFAKIEAIKITDTTNKASQVSFKSSKNSILKQFLT
jgi:hypothetical protein